MSADPLQSARRKIVAIARAMLDGTVTFIEGARIIAGERFPAQLEQDPDILPFAGIDSETDAFPMGDVKRLWKPETLLALAPQIEEAERWAKGFSEPHCHRLIERFS